MDLFGSPQSKPIFDDEPTPGSISNTSLFADDANTKGGSPWDFPTPKKGGRGDMVKRLLPTSEVPDSYVEAFDTIMDVGERQGAGIGPVEVKKILESTSASSDEQARLLRLVTPDGPENDGLGRPEFNVLLALLGLSQEGEDATLDGVDERRKSTARQKM
jgi:sorting nexin-8